MPVPVVYGKCKTHSKLGSQDPPPMLPRGSHDRDREHGQCSKAVHSMCFVTYKNGAHKTPSSKAFSALLQR